MADRRILFSDPMIRAILEGRKTQTRRVIRRMPELFEVAPGQLCEVAPSQIEGETPARIRTGNVITSRTLPYGMGDRVWVREAHAIMPRTAYRGSIGTGTIQQIEHPTDGYSAAVFREGFDRSGQPLWRSAVHMPRWASRLTLTVTDLRIQRLWDISEADAVAEGVEHDPDTDSFWGAEGRGLKGATRQYLHASSAFRDLWDSLNAKRGFGWGTNPWVCAVTFTAHQRNIDQMEVRDV